MAKSINLTTSTRKLADAITIDSTTYFIYRATPNKVCLAIQPDEEHAHAYGRKWLTWDYVLRVSDLADKVKDAIKKLLVPMQVAEPVKKAPKSPKMENCYSPSNKTTVKTKTSQKKVENCYSLTTKKLATAEPTGAWQCDGKVAISPKGRSWTVVHTTKNGFVIMSKSGITGFISHDGRYKSL